MSDQIKYLLDESRMPKAWYNIAADLSVPLPPPLHPGTLQPLGPSDLAPIFPNAIIAQEMSTERYIDIPEPVREVLCQWRPSPLFRARRLEKLLGTPAKIYYKYEGVSPAGGAVLMRRLASVFALGAALALPACNTPTPAACSGWT